MIHDVFTLDICLNIIMMTRQYRELIRQQLLEQSAARYPGNPRLQMLYTIGFLQAQLAEAMHRDNITYYKFQQCIEQAQRLLDELDAK
jgi:hypothetical protein